VSHAHAISAEIYHIVGPANVIGTAKTEQGTGEKVGVCRGGGGVVICVIVMVNIGAAFTYVAASRAGYDCQPRAGRHAGQEAVLRQIMNAT
jgi:hypothetical protein